MENILILDTETTGLHPNKGAIMIECAAILYNLEHKAILQAFSTLYPCQTNDAQHINLIKPDVTQQRYNTINAEKRFYMMADCADAIVAHNAPFDKSFTDAELPELSRKKWICSQREFKWPFKLERFRLMDICAAAEVPYIDAHRALYDCLLMVACFNKVDDLQERFNTCLTGKKS